MAGKKLEKQFDKLDTVYWNHDSVGCVVIADNHAAEFLKWCESEGHISNRTLSVEELLKQYKINNKL
jgi:hypothetical protein